MGINLQRWSGLLVLATLLGSANVPAMAQRDFEREPLRQPTIPEAFDHNSNFNNFFFDTSIPGNITWLLGIPQTWSEFRQGPSWFDEVRIRRAGRRINALYDDVQRQAFEADPAQRTSDLPSPFTTSILEIQKNPTASPGTGDLFDNLDFDFPPPPTP